MKTFDSASSGSYIHRGAYAMGKGDHAEATNYLLLALIDAVTTLGEEVRQLRAATGCVAGNGFQGRAA